LKCTITEENDILMHIKKHQLMNITLDTVKLQLNYCQVS